MTETDTSRKLGLHQLYWTTCLFNIPQTSFLSSYSTVSPPFSMYMPSKWSYIHIYWFVCKNITRNSIHYPCHCFGSDGLECVCTFGFSSPVKHKHCWKSKQQEDCRVQDSHVWWLHSTSLWEKRLSLRPPKARQLLGVCLFGIASSSCKFPLCFVTTSPELNHLHIFLKL